MTDAAAFFANKKKKKKTFKFNANKIDVATVTKTVHVDAPALSTDNDAAAAISAAAASNVDALSSDVNDGGEQWDDEALAANTARKGTFATTNATAELLDMKALDIKGNEQDDIAEKLRVEETRAQLAAAKAGMEKEAQRLKDEKEKKECSGTGSSGTRFGAAAAGLASTGGKWVPPHMRGGGGVGLVGSRIGGPSSGAKLDTENEELFPDLAAADALLAKKKEGDGPVYKVPKKTPVGGGATWGARPKLNLKPKADETVKTAPPEPQTETKAEAASPAPTPEPAPPLAPEPVPTSATEAVKAPIKPKKKKKKDLSTFKASS